MMEPEQEGAFIHLLCLAWQSKDAPCSLPNDDAALAKLSRLGPRWETLGPLVRAQFVEVKGDTTRIRNPKLWAVYRASVAKHKKIVDAGRKGGRAKAAVKRSSSDASSDATAALQQRPSSHNHKERHNQITTKTTALTTQSSARAKLEKRFTDEHQCQALGRFLDSLPKGQNADRWAATISGWLDGLPVQGTQIAQPEDIALALSDYVTSQNPSYSPVHVRSFIGRAIGNRKKEMTNSRPSNTAGRRPSATEGPISW